MAAHSEFSIHGFHLIKVASFCHINASLYDIAYA